MKFKTIKEGNSYGKRMFLCGVIVSFGLIVIITLLTSRAAYRLTKSINIVDGRVSYSPYDFKIMEIYRQKEGQTCTDTTGETCYEKLTGNENRMLSTGYTLNTTNSYCNLSSDEKDTEATLTTNEAGEVVINKLSVRDKCYLYYDKEKPKEQTPEEMLASLNRTICDGSPNFNAIDEAEHKGTNNKSCLYSSQDDDGTSYYFRGKVEDNWVKFGDDATGTDIWWRIIRINGDGSIRMIYAGTSQEDGSAPTSGVDSLINLNYYAYNNSYNNDYYSQYSGSNAETEVNKWFDNNLNDEWNKGNGQIETNGKFCNDWSGTSSAHGAWTRLVINKNPSFKCPTDGGIVITAKAALITADEISFAGGLYSSTNTSYYLNSGEDGYYWTMSPLSVFSGSASVSSIGRNNLFGRGIVNGTSGLRPVINLKSTTQFTGSGITTDPYVVKTS